MHIKNVNVNIKKKFINTFVIRHEKSKFTSKISRKNMMSLEYRI